MRTRRSAAVYEFSDRLIVIADHLTEAGFWRAGLPVVRLLTADDVVGQAVQRALTEAPGPHPRYSLEGVRAGASRAGVRRRVSLLGSV